MEDVKKEPLAKVDINIINNLINKVSELFLELGININLNKQEPKKVSAADSNNAAAAAYISRFEITENLPAFYLKINNLKDIENWAETFASKIEALKSDIDDYINNNADSITPEMSDKLRRLKMNADRALGPLKSRNKRLLDKCKSDSCSSVNDIQDAAAEMYTSLLKDKFMQQIVVPLYEGIRINNDSSYLWLLKKVNAFLADFGIKTLALEAGSKMDYDLPYNPLKDEESEEAGSGQDVVKEILRYAYVFNEPGEYRTVMDGKVIVRKG